MRNNPFNGRVKIARNSSLRKLARAMRRGRVPDERQVTIDAARERAAQRAAAYLNSSPAKRALAPQHSADEAAINPVKPEERSER